MASNANNNPAIRYHQTGQAGTDSPGSATYLSADPFVTLLSPYKSLSFPTSGAITLAPRLVSYAANTLATTTHIYSTPVYADITGLADYFADWGCSYTIAEGPTHTITVQCPWDTITSEDFVVSEYASDQWELVPQQGFKNLLYSGILANPFVAPNVSDGNLQVLPLTLQSTVQIANKSGYGYLNITGSLTPEQQTQYASFVPAANKTLIYMKLGIEGTPQFTQILKRTAVIPITNPQNAFLTAADLEHYGLNANGTINFIYSTPDLLNTYPIPADTVGKFMLPSFSQQMGVVNLDPIHYATYAGWLVKPPSLQFIGRNKMQITQEFVWDLWAEGLFYIKSPITDFPLAISCSGAE